MQSPVLIAASHGTNDPAGQAAVAALVRAVAEASPFTRVLGSFVDVQQPDVTTTLDTLDDHVPVVVVPLLLSAGYHVHVDLANAARHAGLRRIQVTAALGPDLRITGILAERLREAGLADGDHIVLAAAGSSDGGAVADCYLVGRQLEVILGRPVTVAFISAVLPRLPDAVASVRATAPGARVAVARYLLAPGHFAGLAHAAGADLVSAPLLAEGHEPHPDLVDVVIERYESSALELDSLHCDERVTAVSQRRSDGVTTR